MNRIVLATGNTGKIREFSALLAPMSFQIVSQRELGVGDADETGKSFIENAILKARHAAAYTQLPALADDYGIVVDFLRGAPGIYSARFAGVPSNDAANNHKLLQSLEGVPEPQRQARFCCVLAFVLHAEDPTPLIAEGFWSGRILTAARGENGFGYDPLFYVPSHDCSSAELPPEVKAQVSHRAQATAQLLQKLPEKWHHRFVDSI